MRHLWVAAMCSSDFAVVQNVFNEQLLEDIEWSAETFAIQVASSQHNARTHTHNAHTHTHTHTHTHAHTHTQGDTAEQDPTMFLDLDMLDILGPSLNITSELEDSISDLMTSPEIARVIDGLPSLTPLALPMPQLTNNAAEHGSCRTLNTHQTEMEAETKWHSSEGSPNQPRERDANDSGNWKLVCVYTYSVVFFRK